MVEQVEDVRADLHLELSKVLFLITDKSVLRKPGPLRTPSVPRLQKRIDRDEGRDAKSDGHACGDLTLYSPHHMRRMSGCYG